MINDTILTKHCRFYFRQVISVIKCDALTGLPPIKTLKTTNKKNIDTVISCQTYRTDISETT